MRNVYKCMNEMDLGKQRKRSPQNAKKKTFAQLKSKTFFEGKCIKYSFFTSI